MTRRLLAGLLVAGALWAPAAPAAGDPGERLYEDARRAYRVLAEDGPEARSPEAWQAAAERFRRVADDAPGSPKADDALYMVGLCLERAGALAPGDGFPEQAEQAYRRLADGYPRSNLADDALLRAGRLREARGDLAGARALYRQVVERTPAGDMVPTARARLAALGRSAAVTGVRHWSGADYTRVVVDLGASVPYTVRSLPPDPAAGRPARVFVDLSPAWLAPGCPARVPVDDGLLRRVRAGQHDRGTVRVVLDLAGPVTFRAFPLDGPPRLVVDVFRSGGADVVGEILRGRRGVQAPGRALRVVVDAGHGGRDPGALGPGGLREKDVTLALARALARALERRPAFRVKLTRDRDVYLSLEQRTAIANAFGADLFISVHANASRSRRAQGVETYYLDRGSDRAARRLAARENQAREADLAGMEHILADVLLTAKVSESRRLAREVQRALVEDLSRTYGSVRDLGVKRGPFYVLTGAVMPSILVEAAFITHPTEARRLADDGFRRRVAEAMARGVEAFVRRGSG